MSPPSGQKLLNGPTVLLNERVPVFNYLHPLLHEQSATRKPTHRRASQDEAHCKANFPIFIDASSASSILRTSSPASGSSTCAVGRKSSGSSHGQRLLPIYHPGPTMTSVVSILRPLRPTIYFSCSSPPLWGPAFPAKSCRCLAMFVLDWSAATQLWVCVGFHSPYFNIVYGRETFLI